jgi:hypothetical protein
VEALSVQKRWSEWLRRGNSSSDFFRRCSMPERERTLSSKLMVLTRYLILALFGVLVFSALSGEKESGQVHASGIGAAPGFICLNVKANQRFYIVDTVASPKRICVYSLNTDELRLVSGRRIDTDLTIFDGSIKIPRSIEGGNGVTAEEADKYLEAIKTDKEIQKAAAPKYDK